MDYLIQPAAYSVIPFVTAAEGSVFSEGWWKAKPVQEGWEGDHDTGESQKNYRRGMVLQGNSNTQAREEASPRGSLSGDSG